MPTSSLAGRRLRIRRDCAGAFSSLRARIAAASAFTLVELLLAMALVVVLAVVGWMSLGGWKDDTNFEAGVNRFESSLRLARAESANVGLRLRIAFDANGAPRLLYEPKPLEAPGEFVDYVGCTWGDVLDGGLALVTQCQLTGSSAYHAGGMETGQIGDEPVMEAMTFYPDGTSDSALVELRPLDDADPRRAIIELGGLDGSIRTWPTDVDSLADTYQWIHLEEYPDPNYPDANHTGF